MKVFNDNKDINAQGKPPCGTCLSVLLTVLAISTGPAYGLDAYDAAVHDPALKLSDAGYPAPIADRLSPTVTDSCLPLLKSSHTDSSPVMDRNRRSAGATAALGFVFGVRFALGTPENSKTRASTRDNARFDIWYLDGSSAGDRHALAVSAYRQCRKDQALKALNGFRWER